MALTKPCEEPRPAPGPGKSHRGRALSHVSATLLFKRRTHCVNSGLEEYNINGTRIFCPFCLRTVSESSPLSVPGSFALPWLALQYNKYCWQAKRVPAGQLQSALCTDGKGMGKLLLPVLKCHKNQIEARN